MRTTKRECCECTLRRELNSSGRCSECQERVNAEAWVPPTFDDHTAFLGGALDYPQGRLVP